jgi:hypothetical protein
MESKGVVNAGKFGKDREMCIELSDATDVICVTSEMDTGSVMAVFKDDVDTNPLKDGEMIKEMSGPDAVAAVKSSDAT